MANSPGSIRSRPIRGLIALPLVALAAAAMPAPAAAQMRSTVIDRHLCKTVHGGRFVPIVRTFVPFVAGAAALILVLIPGLGREVNGSRRWVSLGFITAQPSEFMKLFCVLYAADYTVRKAAFMSSFKRGFLPMLSVMLVVGGLLVACGVFVATRRHGLTAAAVTGLGIGFCWMSGWYIYVTKIFVT